MCCRRNRHHRISLAPLYIQSKLRTSKAAIGSHIAYYDMMVFEVRSLHGCKLYKGRFLVILIGWIQCGNEGFHGT